MKTLALLACVPLVFASDEGETMSAMLRTRQLKSAGKAEAATSHTSEALAGKGDKTPPVDSAFGKKSHGKFCTFDSDCVSGECRKSKCNAEPPATTAPPTAAPDPPCFEAGVKYEPLGHKISDIDSAMACQEKCMRARRGYDYEHAHISCSSFSFYPDDKICYIQQSGAKKVTESKHVISSKVVELSHENGIANWRCDSSTRRATCGDSPSGSGLSLNCGPGAVYDPSKAANQCRGAQCNGVVLDFDPKREGMGFDHDTCCKPAAE